MKCYRRSDGFQVCDSKNRSIEWVRDTYGGEWVETPPDSLSAEEAAVTAEITEKKGFLASTDYKIIRQIEQGTMSEVDYNGLIMERQAARDRINELEQGV